MTMKPPTEPNEPEYSPQEFRGGFWVHADSRNPQESLDADLTTPESAQVLVSRYDDLDRLVSPNPGVYNWGVFSYEVNTGTAPVTALAGRARGNTVYTISSSGRAYGVDATIHGIEITAGAHASTATATVTSGSDTLTGISVQSGDGSRFEAGMPISGTGIPGGATILAVTGEPSAPTAIQLSANATSSGSGVTVTAQPSGTLDVVGLLLTGNWGSGSATSTGIGISFQAQNDDSRWHRGIQFGSSSLIPTGTGVRFASVVADRGISFESVTLTNALNFSGSSTYSGSIISVGSATATSGLNFTSSNSFSTAAIVLSGQNISTDTTTGMQIATSATQKIGFFGRQPQVRPTVGAASTDLASVITLANNLRLALLNAGNGLGLVSS